MRLLHLSDPHLGTERAEVADALLRLAHELAPDALLVSGDLTQRATPAQFAAARRWLERLPALPRLVVAGNHDIPLWNLWARLRAPYAGYEAHIAPHPAAGVAVLDLPGVRVIAVDTTRWWRHRHGTLSRAQIARTCALLDESRRRRPTEWRIVMTHHPLQVQHAHDLEDRPWGHARALAQWASDGCDLLLSGHLHEPALMVAAPGCWLAQAGSCMSRRLPPGIPNSVHLFSHEAAPGAGRRCERWDYDAASRRFWRSQVSPLGVLHGVQPPHRAAFAG